MTSCSTSQASPASRRPATRESRRMTTGVTKRGRMSSTDGFFLTGQPNRAKVAPQRTFAAALKKRWMEGAVPLALATMLYVAVLVVTPVGLSDNVEMFSEVAQMGLLAIGLT